MDMSKQTGREGRTGARAGSSDTSKSSTAGVPTAAAGGRRGRSSVRRTRSRSSSASRTRSSSVHEQTQTTSDELALAAAVENAGSMPSSLASSLSRSRSGTAAGSPQRSLHASFLYDSDTPAPSARAAYAPSFDPAASVSSSVVLVPGTARIADLAPEDKSKIGRLFAELVALKKQGEQMAAIKAELERRVEELSEARSLSEREASLLRREYDQSLSLLAQYESQLADAQSRAERSVAVEQAQQSQPQQPQQPQQPPPQPPPAIPAAVPPPNPTVTRLQGLSERVRAAANGSFFPASLSPSPSASFLSTSSAAAPSTAALPPFSQVLHSMRSSPFQLRGQGTSAHDSTLSRSALPANGSMHSAAATAAVEDEQPRAVPPVPSPRPFSSSSSSSSFMLPTGHTNQLTMREAEVAPYASRTLREIEAVYARTLEDARRSLSPRRRLDLEAAISSSSSSSHPVDPPSHSQTLSLSDASIPHVSPPPSPPRVVLHSSDGAVPLPSNVSLLPAAVSGVTRTMALSSPQSLERRAVRLAQQMYEAKMEEERRARAWGVQPAHQQQQPGNSSLSSRSSVDSAPNAASAAPSRSSLSSFLSAHPLTSQLSPIAASKRSARQQRDDSRTPRKAAAPSSARKSKQAASSSTVSRSPTQPAPPPAAPSVSEEVSQLLSKSMRLANVYAEERRLRNAHGPNYRPSAATTHSSVEHSPAASASDSDSDADLVRSHVAPHDATPTTRKIRRLLAIQNPARADRERARLQREQQRAREEAAWRERQHEKLQAMAERQRQAERREAEDRAQAEEQRRLAAEHVAATAAAESERSAARRPPSIKPPPHPPAQHATRARAATPAETFVAQPFSYRRSTSRNESIDERESSNQRVAASTDSPAFSSRPSTTATTPASVLSTPAPSHSAAATHVSFTSPAPSANTRSPHDAEDEEVWELFHLRSPTGLQQQQHHAGDDEMMARRGERRRAAREQQPPREHERDVRSSLQQSFASSFAEDMLAAGGVQLQLESTPQPRSAPPVAPFRYSEPYPSSRAAAHDEFAPHTQSAALAPTLAVQSARGVEERVAGLRAASLEAELEELLPAVLRGLQQKQQQGGEHNSASTPQRRTPPRSRHDSPSSAARTDGGGGAEQTISTPIAAYRRKPRTPAREREHQQQPQRDNAAERRSSTPSPSRTAERGLHTAAGPLPSRYAAHVQAYAERMRVKQQLVAAERARELKSATNSLSVASDSPRGFPSFAASPRDSSALGVSELDDSSASLIDIIDELDQ